MNYGQSVLKHPLMVEAIEDLFVPVLIYNNQKEDAALLKQFSEPSWNNPVTRFLNSNGDDVIPRKDGVWTIGAMSQRMVATLKAAKRPIPEYLASIAAANVKKEIATFAMHCYWEGEGKLGSIEGVSNTRSAWLGGMEVVDVVYDPEKVDYSKLVKTAQSFECASKVFARSKIQLEEARKSVANRDELTSENSRVAKLSDQKYYLRNTPILRSLPLTTFQSTKINAALKTKSEIEKWLSPRQVKLYFQLKDKSANVNLRQFVFPEDDRKLAEYQERLLMAINPKNVR